MIKLKFRPGTMISLMMYESVFSPQLAPTDRTAELLQLQMNSLDVSGELVSATNVREGAVFVRTNVYTLRFCRFLRRLERVDETNVINY